MNGHRILVAVSIAGVVILGAWIAVFHRPTVMATQPAARPETHEASLYCDFYNFMHKGTVVSFYFSAALTDTATPRFTELYVVEPDGTKTSFDDTPSPRPMWAFIRDDGTPTIRAPDGATRIVLFGYQPKVSGIIWTEAGIRSDTYKNLDGKCRQAYFGNGPN